MTRRRRNYSTAQAVEKLKHIEDMLRGARMTAQDIAGRIGLTVYSTREYLAHLEAHERVHVVDWHIPPKGGISMPVYTAGPGRRAPCPPRPSAAEKSAKARARRAIRFQQDPEYEKAFKAKAAAASNAWYHAKKKERDWKLERQIRNAARNRARKLKPYAHPDFSWIPRKK